LPLDIPSECAASLWPGSTETMPARITSAAYAASLNPSPSSAATSGVTMAFVLPKSSCRSVPGIPSPSEGYSAPRKPQNSSWTISGVPRKNQMNTQDAHDSTGFFDSRITARTTPPTTPMIIDTTVSRRVIFRPSRIGSLNRNSRTVARSIALLIHSDHRSMAARVRTTAALM
jgi:hypothetical protein